MTRTPLWPLLAAALLGPAALAQQQEETAPEADTLPDDIPDNMQAFRLDPLGSDTPEEAQKVAAEEQGVGGAGPVEPAPEAPQPEPNVEGQHAPRGNAPPEQRPAP